MTNIEIENREKIISFDALYESYLKCRVGVSWKPSVKSFILNSEANLLRMENQLREGTWKNGKPKTILITYPKRREALSVSFKDRIYQRSINDNVLYPAMAKTFIKENCACQHGKGTDYARTLLKKQIWRYYRNNGLEGYVFQFDISGYYLNMKHDKVIEMFAKQVDGMTLDRITGILNNQYQGEKGYNPGSQMVQIAGISYLNKPDHFIKEKTDIKDYIRFMDDGIMFHPSKEYLEWVWKTLEEMLKPLGLSFNPKKTHIQPISKPFTFLGFKYRITETGKAIMSVDSQNVKHERRKLKKMVRKVKRGEMTKSKVDECYASWRNHASKGNSYKLICRMDKYYKNLWKEL